jgi:hypothetical protein
MKVEPTMCLGASGFVIASGVVSIPPIPDKIHGGAERDVSRDADQHLAKTTYG